jgi:2,3-bisphosphoglycerate-independent phosphoglycerate mutase
MPSSSCQNLKVFSFFLFINPHLNMNLNPKTAKVLLLILDGWGIAQEPRYSAIDAAKTPFIDSLYARFPHTELRTDGEFVGLPEGQMGNSEVGHMNLGAGRVVYQNLVRINKAIREGELRQNLTLQKAWHYAKTKQKNIHLVGLVSDGGVHAHLNHLKALMEWAAQEGCAARTFVHAFTDGRDTAPDSGKGFIQEIHRFGQERGVEIATLVGRYYGMDRDKRWERVKLAYDALCKRVGKRAQDPVEALEAAYQAGETDEFIKPIILQKNGQDLPAIAPDDVVICFNFRTDRCRQITEVLSQKDMPEYQMQKLPLHYITFTRYDERFENVEVVFEEQELNLTLGEVLSRAGKKQIRIAETEKYPHVTFFFSGGQEKAWEGEKRILCPSPKVATYDLAPQMSAFDIKDAILPELEKKEADFICLNFANADMVGHTGVMQAAIQACEVVDACVKAVVETALKNDYHIILLADHGNADQMQNPDGTPHTAHTANPVPCIWIANNLPASAQIRKGKLGDIAPTILRLLELEIPKEMTGEILISY